MFPSGSSTKSVWAPTMVRSISCVPSSPTLRRRVVPSADTAVFIIRIDRWSSESRARKFWPMER